VPYQLLCSFSVYRISSIRTRPRIQASLDYNFAQMFIPKLINPSSNTSRSIDKDHCDQW